MAALLAAPDWSIVTLTTQTDGTLVLRVEPTRSSAACPACGTPSKRQHSRYWRRPRDLPWRGPPPPEADGRRRPGRPRLRRYSTRWLAEDPEVARGYALLQRFRRWLQDAQASQLPPFVSMANGLQADRAAVEAALILPWSNCPTEGHNHRVKLLKRAGYGRCSLPQLRARVITAV